MSLAVEKLVRWDESLEPLVAESRSLPGVPPEEERRFQAWVDSVVDRMRHREISALVALENDGPSARPVGLAGYERKGHVIRVHYLFLCANHHEPLAAFLARAEDYWRPAHRVVIEGGPQTLLDEAVGAESFYDAGYQRFERARLELALDETATPEPDPAIIPLPVDDLDGLLALQRVGYLGSPDYLLIDDFEDMVYEMLHDPWFCRQASFAATDGERLVGALYTYHKGELAWIASLCVHPDARGQGLARRLMNHALAAYREAGFERAGLHVTLANRAAAGLYERMGFTLSERISLLYAKVLTPAAAERISGREAASPSDG